MDYAARHYISLNGLGTLREINAVHLEELLGKQSGKMFGSGGACLENEETTELGLLWSSQIWDYLCRHHEHGSRTLLPCLQR